MRAVYWGTMDHLTNDLSSYNLTQTQRLMLAGLGAGAVQSLVDVPIEVVKTQVRTWNATQIILSPSFVSQIGYRMHRVA